MSVPAFFIPGVQPEDQEECFRFLAERIHCAPPPIGERIYSISFRHDAEDWIAIVGEQLRGTKAVSRRVKGKKIERVVPVSDGAMVIAIFPGVPYRVWLDGSRSAWENPFLVGNPTSVVRFDGTTKTPTE